MVDIQTSNNGKDKPASHSQHLQDQDAPGPTAGHIEHIIINYWSYPEERKAQHIEWCLSKGLRID